MNDRGFLNSDECRFTNPRTFRALLIVFSIRWLKFKLYVKVIPRYLMEETDSSCLLLIEYENCIGDREFVTYRNL